MGPLARQAPPIAPRNIFLKKEFMNFYDPLGVDVPNKGEYNHLGPKQNFHYL